ncbi:hypothetical protein SCA03_09460 [Streptomyces cacaoi]|uniref:Uncharacterized protein n=1 Tax=Streptomyces cacaoi TaxID=1898 RepID=A0A4Y3QST7_STRCI|nr:hypothetical protein SCA03_09460 [Streptomyces cacaoi]
MPAQPGLEDVLRAPADQFGRDLPGLGHPLRGRQHVDGAEGGIPEPGRVAGAAPLFGRKTARTPDVVAQADVAQHLHRPAVDPDGPGVPQPALPPLDEPHIHTPAPQFDRQHRAYRPGPDDHHFVLFLHVHALSPLRWGFVAAPETTTARPGRNRGQGRYGPG